MQIEDQWLTRDQAIAQRDVHRKASDEWLGRMIVAILGGNGAALIALANSVVSQGGLLMRLLALMVSGCFLAGVAMSFLALASRRTHHIGQELYYAKRARQMDFDAHFVPHMEPKDVEEMRGRLNEDVVRTEDAAILKGDAANSYLTRSMLASVLGALLMIAALLFAPSRKAVMDSQTPMQSTVPTAVAPTRQPSRVQEESARHPTPTLPPPEAALPPVTALQAGPSQKVIPNQKSATTDHSASRTFRAPAAP